MSHRITKCAIRTDIITSPISTIKFELVSWNRYFGYTCIITISDTGHRTSNCFFILTWRTVNNTTEFSISISINEVIWETTCTNTCICKIILVKRTTISYTSSSIQIVASGIVAHTFTIYHHFCAVCAS